MVIRTEKVKETQNHVTSKSVFDLFYQNGKESCIICIIWLSV